MEYLLVSLIGGVVGASELLFRYRDAPRRTFKKGAAWLYVLSNAVAAGVALLLIRTFGWDFGRQGDGRGATQILVAGFGSVALFRSNLFVLKAGDQNIGAGPSLLLTSLLGAADRTVDREQAEERNAQVRPIMDPVDFNKAKESLVAVCVAASSSVSAEEAQSLKTAVAALEVSPGVGPKAKSFVLGLLLIQVVGVSVLRSAVACLRDEIGY